MEILPSLNLSRLVVVVLSSRYHTQEFINEFIEVGAPCGKEVVNLVMNINLVIRVRVSNPG